METISDLFDLPNGSQFVRVTVRLVVAAILGGILGFERERKGKAAGLRTHILVALGTALFTIAPLESGMSIADLSRVFQGIATGIGFIGAGTILKRTEQEEIKGLTTAASIWLTAAIGTAVGAGRLWLPILGAFFAWITLSVLGYVGTRMEPPDNTSKMDDRQYRDSSRKKG
jgi:putative Mg2+ transporter-C (MgtC) family protein